MGVRPLRMPQDADALSRLDAGSTSSTVIDVVTTAAGFALTEAPVPVAVTKNHEFVAELTGPDRPWTDGYVAVDDEGDIVGFAATVYRRWNRRQVLWHLYVDRASRGRGIGRALTNQVMRIGRDNGARQLWLETQNTNATAVAAYRAMGFELIGLDRTLYDGDHAHETALYLAKPL